MNRMMTEINQKTIGTMQVKTITLHDIDLTIRFGEHNTMIESIKGTTCSIMQNIRQIY